MSEAVFVLGMHRSGTSLVAGVMRILGVDFGPDSQLMAPNPTNRKGFFEHIPLNGINVEVLTRLGGDWCVPPNFTPGWEDSVSLAELRKEAVRRIQESFGASPLWGFKDPRTCLTFPFWRKVVPCPLRVVVVVRNPIDSARSVEKVQRILASEGCELWLKHMVGAIAGSRGLPRHVLCYEDLMGDFQGELKRLASFLRLPLSEGKAAQAAAFSDKGLRNFESTTADVIGKVSVPPRVRKAYLTMRAFADVARQGQLELEDEAALDQIFSNI